MERAPGEFHADLADGPDRARAWTVSASDGTGLRVVTWAAGDRGTVLLFPGRNEHAEKYGPVAALLAAAGFSSAVIDWRGQGMSQRTPGIGIAGHVGHYDEYQHDVQAMVDTVRADGLPEPLFLIAHSMGCAIGLAALARGLPVRAAAFSAPMWGLVMGPAMRPLAGGLSKLAEFAGFDTATVPVRPSETYMLVQPFEGNALTTDRATYEWLVTHPKRDPRLGIGRPTFGWLGASLAAIEALAALPAPAVPVYVGLASEDIIVDNAAAERLVRNWADVRVEIIKDARHELLIERPEVRDRFLAAATALFECAR